MAPSNVPIHFKNAMDAYSPLAYKVFGSEVIPTNYKLFFFGPLVLSRLLFNMHIAAIRPRELRRMNTAYMGVLCRIAGEMKFSVENAMADIEVRRHLHFPPIDAKLRAARLKSAAKIANQRPESLMTILSFRKDGQPLQ